MQLILARTGIKNGGIQTAALAKAALLPFLHTNNTVKRF